MLLDIKEIKASALYFRFCQSEWFIFGIRSWTSSLISPLPWFDIMLLFYMVFPPAFPPALEGGPWVIELYFLSYFFYFSLDTFRGGI